MKCDKCESIKNIEEHHIFWKCMRKDNQNIEDGERVWLCEKCHDMIADCVIPVIWKYVNKKGLCKLAIKSFTKKWVQRKNYS